MVRGKINQSSAFDTSGHHPASQIYSQTAWEGKAIELSPPIDPLVDPQITTPAPPPNPALDLTALSGVQAISIQAAPLTSSQDGAKNTLRNAPKSTAKNTAKNTVTSTASVPAIGRQPQNQPPGQSPLDYAPLHRLSSDWLSLDRFSLDRLPKHWQWHAVWIGALGLFGGIGLSAYVWLASLPPLPDCQTITPLSADGHRLYCAQEMARSGKLEDLLAGIALVKNWSPNHPLYRDAQQSLAKWSRLVMLAARDQMNQNDFPGAISTIKKIPQTSPVYEEAQKTAAQWQAQWAEGEAIYAKAVEAIKQQNWREAFDQVTELGYLEHDYWRLQQADGLAKQISVQKESYEALKQAKKLAKKLLPEHLGEAIALLQSVAPESDAWTEAQGLLTEWSQNLLKTALLNWQEGNPTDAIKLAQQVPLNLTLSAEAQDLVRYSHAHRLVEESQIEAKLSWRQIWSLLEATTALKQIQPSSPLYDEAQAKLQDWQAQLQDLQQLQVANVMADLRQQPMLEYAITQANQITPERQRHAQAQTMIANWKSQIERLEDSPYLRLAQQFAATQVIPDLQLAIVQAQVIPPQRALWAEAQTQILAWQQQIERLEDQPILDKALALAKLNKWDEAIAIAAEIRPDRALSEQAQAAIATWKEKIRAVEMAKDQSVLDQARGFAGRGQLTDAIATANQLSPGRPLYLEAQAAIGAWLRERDGDLKTGSEAAPLPDSGTDQGLDQTGESSESGVAESADATVEEPASADLPAAESIPETEE